MLFNKKLLAQHIAKYNFPEKEKLEEIERIISRWQTSLKDSDLNKTKETTIQGQFLIKFFETVLGYHTQTSGFPEWNLIPEPKTDVDSQEADGALGFFTKDKSTQKVKAVIELKDAKTLLDKKQTGRVGKLTPVEQAFNYLNKFDGCEWAIVSNFREIRLYSKARGQGFYEKFDIVELHQDFEFKKFYFLLNKENLISDGRESVVAELVKNTTAQEENITKEFYAEYKDVRLKLLRHLFENNPDIDKLILVEKTQKLLDRFIFTLVCEDTTTLLPAHLVKKTYEVAINSFLPGDERVWTQFKGLFKAIDEGNSQPHINRYNGGLFKSDTILDELIVKDNIWPEIISLTKYDFESELNVNVLGHIFEQSINDLEELKAKIDDTDIDKKKSLRKKQGIFYTPEYITKFIIENTVGKYLEEHPDKLETIKILDPACGSGAFLNQAHSFLLNEYKIRTEQIQLEKHRQGEALTLWDMNIAANDKSILLNNIYGVDLSPESVEISKLALWLKTANAAEPLQNLDNNIKCGNSLINDEAVAGKRAFDWSSQFSDIMNDGKFDVIIGNPPYIFARNKNFSVNEKAYYYDSYELTNYQLNTYVLFIEQAFRLLKEGGYLGYIIPNTWLTIETFTNLRKYLLKNAGHIHIINIYDKVFEDASVDTCILLLKKDHPTPLKLSEFKNMILDSFGAFDLDNFNDDESIINISLVKDTQKLSVMQKISSKSQDLSDISNIVSGFKAYETGKGIPAQTDEMKMKRIYHSEKKVTSEWDKYLDGKDVKRYSTQWTGGWIKYGEWLAAQRKLDYYLEERILVRQIPSHLPYCVNATYIDEPRIFNDMNSMIVRAFKKDPYFLLATLNSKITSFWFANKFDKLQRKTFPQFKVNELSQFPIPLMDPTQVEELSQLAKKVIKYNEKFNSERSRLLQILLAEYKLKKTMRLSDFYLLGWNEFIDEISKQKINIELLEQDRLSKWFLKAKKHLTEISNESTIYDKQIDSLLYSFYGLDSTEVQMIESF